MALQKIKSTLLQKEYEVYRHPSGLTVLLVAMPGFSSYYGLFGTKYGSVDTGFLGADGKRVELPAGIAHFLEHKLFESEDGDAFAKYAATGAYSNAYTSFDRTCYLFSCSRRFYDNLEILLDFVRSPYFTAATVEKEQGIIGQEIKMYDDMPNWRVLFNMLEGMFHNHPVRTDIAGTVDSIAQISHSLLYDCYHRFYSLSNMFLVLAGDFQTQEVASFIEKHLTEPKESIADTDSVLPNEPTNVVTHRVVAKMDVAKPLFSIGFKSPEPVATPDAKQLVTMEILMKMLAGPATPLYKQLLDEGLINEEFSMEFFNGRGFALPLFDGESEHPDRVLDLLLQKAESFRCEGIDEILFEAVRRELYGHCILRFDSSESVCAMLADSYVLGYDLFAYFDLLAHIQPADILPALDWFRRERSVLSVIEPNIQSGGENK